MFRGFVRWENLVSVRPCLSKELEKGEFIGFVEGLAATSDVDLEGEKFEEEVFRKNAANLVGKPVMLFHGKDRKLRETAVGEIVETTYKPGEGLWIKAGIYRAFENVWKMVKTGLLKALSIGGYVKKIRFDKNVRVIEDAEITEVSLTSRPANPRARIYTVFGKSVVGESTGPKAVVSNFEAVVKNSSSVLDTPFFQRFREKIDSHRIKHGPDGEGREPV